MVWNQSLHRVQERFIPSNPCNRSLGRRRRPACQRLSPSSPSTSHAHTLSRTGGSGDRKQREGIFTRLAPAKSSVESLLGFAASGRAGRHRRRGHASKSQLPM